MDTVSAQERALLEAFLDVQRAKIAGLLDDVDEEQARARLVPSLTTVLGLVKHAVFVEQVWIHGRVADVGREDLGLVDTVDESFALTDDDTVASVGEAFAAACARSREILAEHDLDETFDWRGTPVNLRWILAHMVAELAQHAGHEDILVEQVLAG